MNRFLRCTHRNYRCFRIPLYKSQTSSIDSLLRNDRSLISGIISNNESLLVNNLSSLAIIHCRILNLCHVEYRALLLNVMKAGSVIVFTNALWCVEVMVRAKIGKPFLPIILAAIRFFYLEIKSFEIQLNQLSRVLVMCFEELSFGDIGLIATLIALLK